MRKKQLEMVNNDNDDTHPENAGVGLFQSQKVLLSLRVSNEDWVTVGIHRQIQRFSDIGDIGVDIDVGLIIVDGEKEQI